MDNELIENDRFNAPFLLAASFSGLVKFVGSETKDGVLYWRFSPKETAQKLIEQFNTKTESRTPAKDLLEATALWWQQVSELKTKFSKKRREKI